MKMSSKFATFIFAGACVACGLFYLIRDFGKAIVGQYALALLLAVAVLIISLVKNKGKSSGLAKAIGFMILLTQLPIMFCWAVWFPFETAAFAISAHVIFCIIGAVYLIFAQMTTVEPGMC